MISAPEALGIILDTVRPLGTITLSIERAPGYVLAEDIVSAGQVPPFDNAAMDGFAVRSQDAAEVPVTLTLAGEIAAGAVPASELARGEAIRIMTGAKIPAGSDAVIQQEWTSNPDPHHVTILRTIPKGHNIRRAGADIPAGITVLTRGSLLRPQEIGVLASLGKRFIIVHRKPSVAILATGSEIVEIDKPVPEGKIRNSNAYVLSALARQLGCDAGSVGIAPDELGEIKRMMTDGLRSDLLITSGGVSVGKYDLVLSALEELGGTVKFWKVNIKPGMPLMFGLCREKPVFGLPGNPVSSMVTFLQFVKPALLQLMGRNYEPPLRLHAKLEEEIKKSDGKLHFVRGVLASKDGAIRVRTTGSQVSNVLTSLSRADCLIILPEDRELFRQGEDIEVELL
jgi:molybdopterin molybdotransferase